MNTRTLLIVLLGVLTVASVAHSQESSAQFFSPGVGVIIHHAPLYWTDDNGRTWRDIEPDFRGEQAFATFFLNRSQGWALLASGDYGETKYGLASTNDSGATWSLTHINLTANPHEIIILPQGHMQFSDVNHGWINLDVESGSAFHGGYLLRTVDGGKNWTFAGGPSAGEIRFIDPQTGWLVYGGDLWVTHDAAAHWEQVSVKPPPGIDPKHGAFYHLPVLTDRKHGVMEVNFTSPPTQSTDECQQSLFVSDHAGRNWKFKQMLAREAECKEMVVVSAGDSTVIVADSSGETLTLKKFDLGGSTKPTTTSSALGFLTMVVSASFVTPQQGWVETTASCKTACSTCVLKPAHAESWGGLFQQCGALLSTSDGGKTWTDITLRQTCVIDSTTWKKTCTRQ